MRVAALLMLVGCSFAKGQSPDARPIPDSAPDVTAVPWTVDSQSGKGTPATAAEWTALIAARSLNLSPPDGLWLLQDPASPLADTLGSVELDASGGGVATFREPVAGWARRAVGSSDGTATAFVNTTDPSLPNVGSASMTVLVFYATASPPAGQPRALLYGGCCVPSTYAEVDIDPANHFVLTIDATSVTGAVDHGTGVIPLVMKLDQTNMAQELVTNLETIPLPYTALGSSHGLFIGGASNAAPDGRWLYMAAWYGANAEISDPEIAALLHALGWP